MNRHFEMRKLTKKDIREFDDLLAYAFQVTTKVLGQAGWSKDEMRRSKKPIFDSSYVLGWFYKDQLASQIVIYPMEMNIHGRICAVGGITGVATYPEYTGQGLVHSLMRECIRHMKESGETLGVLCPYSIPFYRTMGWELISDKMQYIIRDNQLPKKVPVPGMAERVDVEHEDIREIYRQHALIHHGALVRGEREWEEYWRWDSDDIKAAVYYTQEEEPAGFVIYELEEEVLRIKEMVYLSQEAKHGLWNYISAHYSMVNFVKGYHYDGETIAFELPDSEITETITPNIMGRIVDVCGFVNQYPFQNSTEERTLYLRVEDGMADWNNGLFRLDFYGSSCRCEPAESTGGEPVIRMDIRTLTTMMMGYKRPFYLWRNERIEADDILISQLEKRIPHQKPQFSDYF